MSSAATSSAATARIGIVTIGRNEGERLERCLEALPRERAVCVYVDSGSTDGSLAAARTRGVEVVELDLATPFTAARARNAGFARLQELRPGIELVQFLDGDCVLDTRWLPAAEVALAADSRLAVVCGRRRERFPEKSVYNRLCDLEWDTPVGAAEACGGDALMRCEAFRAIGGYDPTLIAGEEPDLCFRLLRAGWRIERIDCEMTLHDAAMHRFSQWWSRVKRAGHAAIEGAYLHGRHADTRAAKRVRSVAIWAVLWPLSVLAVIATALAVGAHTAALAAALLGLAAYALLFVRITLHRRRRGDALAHCTLYAMACVLGKWPEASGMALFLQNRARGKRSPLIEYKSNGRAA